MQEFDDIRKLLIEAQAQAPDFDILFKGETLGEDPMRSALQTKLLSVETKAPGFDELFAGEVLGKSSPAPKGKFFPWWTVAAVAAACLAVFFLLPDQLVQNPEALSVAVSSEKKMVKHRPVVMGKTARVDNLKAQLLSNPKTIKLLKVVPRNTAVQEATLAQTEPSDTTPKESLDKITPTRNTGLSVRANRSLQETYADARLRKRHIRPDKVTFGMGMNSANRLLSMVNTKTDAGFALQSVASTASDGYASLEGASTSMLRTTTTSPNEWIGPENITAAMLQNCETTYSLPVSLGLTVSLPIVHDLNLITGIQYTYLANHISGDNFNLKQELHYLGIPVKLAVNMVKRGDFVVYSAIGGSIEKGLSGVQTSTVEGEGTWKGSQSIEGIQTSLTGQFGLSYQLKSNLLLYFEPGVAWCIPSDQPISNRTEEPFNFNVSLGLRYRLQ